MTTTRAADDLTRATVDFIETSVLPVDDEFDGDIAAAGGDVQRVALQEEARKRGVFAPHGPVEHGGGGLDMTQRTPVFEAAGYSLFGPLAINAQAPDEGNMHLLHEVGSPAQQERFLGPLVRGDLRSAFAMTEPAPGAGSDPSAIRTRAVRTSDGWSISGRKLFITGADGAGFLIVMARTSGEPGDAGGATMFLTPANAPGIEIVRHVPTTDRSMIGGHCELAFDDLVVPEDDVLGEVDQGFAYAQVRLGPARMTHVMRWLGAARRAHDVAVRHTAQRRAFGGPLSDLGMIQQLIADNEIDLAATRALLMNACRDLDEGADSRNSTSIAKTFAAEALDRVADRATQMCGGLGVSADLPIAKIARELRAFRIYDGPSEVHRWSIARRSVRRVMKSAPSLGTGDAR